MARRHEGLGSSWWVAAACLLVACGGRSGELYNDSVATSDGFGGWGGDGGGGGSDGGGGNSDDMDTVADVIDRGRLVVSHNIRSMLPSNSGGAWYRPDIDERRVAALLENNALWIKRHLGA